MKISYPISLKSVLANAVITFQRNTLINGNLIMMKLPRLEDYAKHFFLYFQANWENNSIRKVSETFHITGNLKIDGKGNQVTEMIMQESKKHLLHPFTFHWIKSSPLPWSWKLIKIEHSKLEVPSGYVPGKSFNSSRW